MPEQKRPLRPRIVKPLESGERMNQVSPLLKKDRVKLDHTLELLLSASKLEFLSESEGKEA
ncbi:hypothetical protein COCNU_scaffold013835G000010 [Cocos nucifera]|nr:hypothetical protein [Cocos nucifera]